jgi:GNAT superfamily N-acetyltransferase
MLEAITASAPDSLLIRDIASRSNDEINLVASRMEATLVEVEGAANAAKLHSAQWLRDRLLWHVQNPDVVGKALVAVLPTGEVIGHTLLRREADPTGSHIGLFSTTYVVPPHRTRRVASRLLLAGEAWFREIGVFATSTWTSQSNTKLIRLFEQHGYQITSQGTNDVTGTVMVNLTKVLRVPSGAA